MKIAAYILFWLSAIAIVVLAVTILIARPINPFLVYLTLFVVSSLFILLLLFSIQRLIWTLLKGVIECISTGRLSKLIGLGVSSILLFGVPNQLAHSLFTFSITLASEVESSFATAWSQRIAYSCGSLAGNSVSSNGFDPQHILERLDSFLSTQCFAESTIAIPDIWVRSLNTAYMTADFANLRFDRLMLFVALWVIATISVDQIRGAHHRRNIFVRLRESDPKYIWANNITFFVLLGIGLYLSIASIAAIPSLQDSPDVIPVGTEKLQEEFNSSIDIFVQKYPIEGDDNDLSINPFYRIGSRNPFSEIQATLDSTTTTNTEVVSSNLPIPAETQSDIVSEGQRKYAAYWEEQVRFYLTYYAQRRADILDLGNQLPILIRSELDRMAKSAVTQYEYSSMTRKGDRETVEHFLLLTNWFNYRFSVMEGGINQCLDSIENLDREMTVWSGTQKRYLEAGVLPPQPDLDSSTQVAESMSRASDSCANRDIIRSYVIAPERPELGDFMGPFSIVASWLLRTESLPLALITGLVGFGLLGAACSSFVRERTPLHPKSAGPLVADLPKIVVIGLSAAILAFLAAMGGLAVFFTDGSTPNPYALLLSCLVAAVFGESVWKWARGELDQRLPNAQKKTGQAPPDTKPAPLQSSPASLLSERITNV